MGVLGCHRSPSGPWAHGDELHRLSPSSPTAASWPRDSAGPPVVMPSGDQPAAGSAQAAAVARPVPAGASDTAALSHSPGR